MSARTSPQRGLPPAAVVVAGSAECPFRLAIVGGGPSGCSVLVRAARIGLVSELCSFSFRPAHTHSQSASPTKGSASSGNSGDNNAESGTDCFMRDMERASAEETTSQAHTQAHTQAQRPTAAGVCLFDAGPSTRLGGGRLQDYVINSNTWIAKFAANVLEEKPDGLPPEHVRGTVFERLTQMPSTQTILKIGNKTGPLQSVGGFLRDVGATVLSLLAQYPQSCRVFTETKVHKLQKVLDENGSFLMWKITYSTITTTTAAVSLCPLSPSDRTADAQLTHVNTETAEVFAFHVLFATGGHQAAPRFAQASLSAKTLCSDEVCTEEGVRKLREMLRKASHTHTGTGRVAIIGGSHSAFSAAWVLLNRVDENNTSSNSNNNANNGISKTASTSNTSTNTPNAPSSSSAKIKLGPSGVCILFRSPVKVFYATKAEADHDHYGQDGPLVVNKTTGQINPFGGIRGDAKELWRNIRANKEPRVRMLQIKTNIAVAPPSSSSRTTATLPSSSSPASFSNAANFGGVKQSIVDKILEEATVIIWACGYSTNTIPILEANGDPISISFSRGQVDVDDQARVLLQSSSRCVENLYGSGLGYGLKATLENGELDGSSGRADGVAVYLKRGATLVLAHVLGSRVFGGVNISSWEERNKLIRKQNAMNGGSNNNNEESGKLSILVDSPVRTTVATVRAASTTPGSRRSRAGSIASPSPAAVVPLSSSFRSPNSRRSTPARPLDREKHNIPLSPTVQQKREQVVLRPASTGRCSSFAMSPRVNSNSTLSTAASGSTLLSTRNDSRSASVSASASAVRARCVNSNSAPATPPPRIVLSSTAASSTTLSVAGVSPSKQTSMVVASKTLPLRNPVGIAANANVIVVNKSRSATPTNLKAITTRGSKPSSNTVGIKPKPFPPL